MLMPARLRVSIGLFLTFALAGLPASAADEPSTKPSGQGFSETATEWIDAATGHRIIRLSNEPGSLSLYFHQYPYTPRGDKLIIYTPKGLSTVNLKTRAVELVAPGVRYGAGSSAGIEVGRKTPTVYYQKDEDGQTVIYATDVDTKATRVVSKLGFTGQFGGVNADETLIIGKRRRSRRSETAGAKPGSAGAGLASPFKRRAGGGLPRRSRRRRKAGILRR